jgi:hypothetical protein
MMKMVAKKSRDMTSSKPELSWPGSVPVSTMKIPKTPNAIEAQMNTRVAIFCMSSV